MSYDLNCSHVFRSSRPEIVSFGFLRHFFSGGSLLVGSEEFESTCAGFLGLELFSKVGFVEWGRWMAVDSGRVNLICARMILEPAHSRLEGGVLYFYCVLIYCALDLDTMTVMWTGILLLISPFLQQGFKLSSNRAEF